MSCKVWDGHASPVQAGSLPHKSNQIAVEEFVVLLISQLLTLSYFTDRLKKPVTGRDRIQGSIDAPIMLVKYGSYQCPYSDQAYIFVKEIQRRLGEQVCFVFRHFPLIAIHAQAQKTAEVAEVAAAQGKFWEMHDILFQHQQALDKGFLVEYAIMLSLDINRFLREMSECVYARVHADLRSGVYSGVVSTPTFVNSVRYQQACDLQGLLNAIAQASNS